MDKADKKLLEEIQRNYDGLKYCPFCKVPARRVYSYTCGYYIQCDNGCRYFAPDWRDTDSRWNSREGESE